MPQADVDIILVDKETDFYSSFPCTDFSISDAPSFAPRISNGRSDQSDLDSTLEQTITFENGGLQKDWRDAQSVNLIRGFYNDVDARVYPFVDYTTISHGAAYTGTAQTFTAKASSNLYAFIAIRENTTNRIYKIDATGAITALTLPAAISGSTIAVTSMTLHKKFLYVTGQTSSTNLNLHRYDIAANTWLDMGTAWYLYAVPLRNTLYVINIISQIWSVTGEDQATAASLTPANIATVGIGDPASDLPLSMCEFNGALWISKSSGLYRFDGVNVVKIFTFKPDYLTYYNGALYFMRNGWLMRFNGSLLEKIQYFGPALPVSDLQAHLDYLAISVQPVSSVKYARTAFTNNGTTNTQIYLYNGNGFFLIRDTIDTIPFTYLSSVGNLLIHCSVAGASTTMKMHYADFNLAYKATATASSNLKIVTSDIDCGLPNIPKVLHRIELDIDNISASDQITIAYELKTTQWGGTAQTLTQISGTKFLAGQNYVTLPDANGLYNIFNEIRVSVVIVPFTGSSVSLKSISLHYTLHPRPRSSFTLTVPIGNKSNALSQLTSRNGTPYNLDSSSYYEDLRSFKLPSRGSFLLSPQIMSLATQLNASVLSMVVSGNYPITVSPAYNIYPYLAVYDANHATYSLFPISAASYNAHLTTFTIVTRSNFGQSAVNVYPAGTEVRLAYQIGDFQILNDALILDDSNAIVDSYGVTQFNRNVRIKITEV